MRNRGLNWCGREEERRVVPLLGECARAVVSGIVAWGKDLPARNRAGSPCAVEKRKNEEGISTMSCCAFCSGCCCCSTDTIHHAPFVLPSRGQCCGEAVMSATLSLWSPHVCHCAIDMLLPALILLMLLLLTQYTMYPPFYMQDVDAVLSWDHGIPPCILLCSRQADA